MNHTPYTPRPIHHEAPVSRRDFLLRAGGGLGGLALLTLLEQDAKANARIINPIAPRQSHFQPKAKSVIWCFLDGGPSHVDLFDPKPQLAKLNGTPLPDTFERPVSFAN